MPTTPLQGLTVPAASDPPNGPSQMTALAASAESKLVQVYATSSARTAAFAAAGISAAAGMLSVITGTKRVEVYDGAQWAPLPGQMIGYHKLASSVTYNGTEIGVIRANATVLAGYRYTILSSPLRIGTVSGETGKVNLRYSTVANAGTADTVLTSVEANGNSTFAPAQSPAINVSFAPGANVTLSVALTLTRSGGTGAVTLSGTTTQPIELMILAAGPDPGDTGANL